MHQESSVTLLPPDPCPKVFFVLVRPEESGVHRRDSAGPAKPTHTAQTATSWDNESRWSDARFLSVNNPLSHNEGSYLCEGFILLCGFFGSLSFFREVWGGNNNAQVCDFLKGELTRTFVLLIEGEPLEIGLADPGRRYATGNPNERNEKKEKGKKQTNKKKAYWMYRIILPSGPAKGIGWDSVARCIHASGKHNRLHPCWNVHPTGYTQQAKSQKLGEMLATQVDSRRVRINRCLLFIGQDSPTYGI